MILEKIAQAWSLDEMVSDMDLIAVITYGSTKTRPTHGTLRIAEYAKNIQEAHDCHSSHSKLSLGYGIFTFSPDLELERKDKKDFFPQGFCAGEVASTIEECQKIREFYLSNHEEPKKIMVITGASHSRTAKLVWKTYFPNTEISVRSIPISFEIDEESPMVFMRNAWMWFGINFLRHIVFSIIGVKRMESFKLHQPVVKTA